MHRITLAGMLKIELRAHTVLLCDGGSIPWGADTYTSHDSLFGGLSEVEAISEGVGDEAPAFTLTFLPDPTATALALIDPAHQGARVRMWIAEINEMTGLIVGVPDQQCDMLIDVPRLRFPETGRLLEVDCVSGGQRLMNLDEGNVLNGGFHKRRFPGETGLDDCTGVSSTFAWGAGSARGTR